MIAVAAATGAVGPTGPSAMPSGKALPGRKFRQGGQRGPLVAGSRAHGVEEKVRDPGAKLLAADEERERRGCPMPCQR
jgi:hypothetical protein